MAAIVVDAAATAAVLASNFVAGFLPATLLQKSLRVRVWPGGFCLIENELHHLMVQTIAKENSMEKQVFAVGERVDKLCAKCEEERGHIVTAVNKRGQISRVSCPKCGIVSTCKLSSRTSPRLAMKVPSAYDRTTTYRDGQSITHETFGVGTRIEMPSSFPFRSGITSPTAVAAPVVVGMIDKKTTGEEVNAAFKEAADGAMKGIMEYVEAPLVSIDFRGNPHSSIIDAPYTKVMDGDFVKVLAWYDNEWGYSNRCVDLLRLIVKKGL